MVLTTTIARVDDPLVLCESMDQAESEQMNLYKKKARQLLAKIKEDSPPLLKSESGPFYFLYLKKNNVVYLSLCNKAYPVKLATSFLQEIAQEFDLQHGSEVRSAQRPYQFIRFDTFIQKTKKVYTDGSSQQNLDRVSKELSDVHNIITRSLDDILARGEKLDNLTQKSGALLQESMDYEKMTKMLNRNLMWRKYGPVLVLLLLIIGFIYFRYYYYV